MSSPRQGNLMVTSWAAQNREEAMMLRIIHGKLKPGTWDSYERAYKDIVATASADKSRFTDLHSDETRVATHLECAELS